MTDKDMELIADYFIAKSFAASWYVVAIKHQNNLKISLNALLEWQYQVDQQLRIWNQMKDTKRIEGIMIASGFTG